MVNKKTIVLVCLLCVYALSPSAWTQTEETNTDIYKFTDADIVFLKNFSLSVLPPPPPSFGNRFADNIEVAKFGKKLFFDKRLSKRGKFSCASCHQPEKYFTDGLAKGVAFGEGERSTPTLLGTAWSPWQYWDGRKDSLWAQALAPIEHPDEMNLSRSGFVRALVNRYAEEYQSIFGELADIRRLKKLPKNASPQGDARSKKRWQRLPIATQKQINVVFSNAGKSLMAYQRQLKIPQAPFDVFVDSVAVGEVEKAKSVLDEKQVSGLRLFMGKANCASCHNGPLFTNFEFHNIGAPEPDVKSVDLGRYTGVSDLTKDEFTCLSEWSDAQEGQCEEMEFLKRTGPELVGAFKTPTLRNIVETAPYMQAGQFADLKQVLNHYNKPVPPFYDREQHPSRPHFDILPLLLSEEELDQIIAFLDTLTSPYPKNDSWWSESP